MSLSCPTQHNLPVKNNQSETEIPTDQIFIEDYCTRAHCNNNCDGFVVALLLHWCSF